MPQRSVAARRHVWYNSRSIPREPPMSSDPSGEFHRIRRLPPYVFAEVNTAKAKARGGRRGHHRPRHGQSRQPDAAAHRRQAGRGGAGPAHPSLLRQQGHSRTAAGAGRLLPAPLRRRAGPGNRGDRHARLQGGPGEPGLGDHQPGRHDPGAQPVLSDPPVRLHHRRRRGALACPPRRTTRCCGRWTARCGTRCRSRPR